MIHSLRTKLQNGVLALGMATLLFACGNEEIFETAEPAVAEKIALTFKKDNASVNGRIKAGVAACAEKKVDLIVGQKSGLGEVSIYKDATKLVCVFLITCVINRYNLGRMRKLPWCWILFNA